MWTSDGNEYFDILSNKPKWEGLRSFHWCIYQRLSFSGLYGSAENTLLKTENYTILCAPFSRQIHDRCSRDFHVTGTLVHKSQNGAAARHASNELPCQAKRFHAFRGNCYCKFYCAKNSEQNDRTGPTGQNSTDEQTSHVLAQLLTEPRGHAPQPACRRQQNTKLKFKFDAIFRMIDQEFHSGS